jgi:quercetin dioxygenase-like cupin family protein
MRSIAEAGEREMVKRRALLASSLVMIALVVILTTGTVLAAFTPVGLVSQLQTRGTLEKSERAAFIAALAKQSPNAASTLAVVKVTINAAGSGSCPAEACYTGFHGHSGPSLVVVDSGTLTMYEPLPGGRCSINDYGPGSVFMHPATSHDFRNETSTPAVIFIVYFLAGTSWPQTPSDTHEGGCAPPPA